MSAVSLSRAEKRLESLTTFGGGPRGLWLSFVAVLLCLAGFAATTTSIGRWVDTLSGARLPEGSYQRSKAVYFDAHADEYDMVFLGSSQVWRHVVPPVLEEELLKSGLRLTGFNLGLPGATFPEVMARGLALAEQKPKRLRWVVCELRPLFPRLFAENDLSLRQIEWHTAEATSLLVPFVWHSDRPLAKRIARARLHLQHAVYRGLNVGMLLPALRRRLGFAVDVDPTSLLVHGGKAIDVEAKSRPELQQRARQFIRDRGELPERIAELLATEPETAAEAELELLRLFISRLRGAGIEPIFFLSAPTWDRLGEFTDAYARGVLPSLFAYNDPERYPAFYSAGYLFDFGHMRSSGAELFSRQLGRDLAELLKTL